MRFFNAQLWLRCVLEKIFGYDQGERFSTKRQELSATANQLRRQFRLLEACARDDQPAKCDVDTDRFLSTFCRSHKQPAGARAEIKHACLRFFQLCFHGGMQIEEMPSAFNSRKRSEEHTSELQSRRDLVCRLLLEKKKK